jgi:hypothetical protein
MMGHDMARNVGKALILFNGPRHGEHRLRVEVRRGLRPWADFYTCCFNYERSCKVAFKDRVEVMGTNPPEVLEMPLVGDKDRKFWRFCEDLRISCAKKAQSRLRKADFAACHADFETALVGWPWGTDVADLVANLTAARGVPFEPMFSTLDLVEPQVPLGMFYCAQCQLDLNGAEDYWAHMAGKFHENRVPVSFEV